MTEASERASQRYEYTVVGAPRVKDKLEKRLNAMAEDGWQLVEQVIKDDTTYRFIFERPLSDAEMDAGDTVEEER